MLPGAQATTAQLAESSNESAQTVNRALLHLQLVHQVSAAGESRPLLLRETAGESNVSTVRALMDSARHDKVTLHGDSAW